MYPSLNRSLAGQVIVLTGTVPGVPRKTFEVRARPSQMIEGVRPGMSVLVE